MFLVLQRSYKDVFIFLFVILELSMRGDNLFFHFSSISIKRIFIFVALALCFILRLLDLLLLFIVLSFLQTDEILTIDFVQLLLDIVNDLGDARNQNELERVHTSVSHLQGHIKSHELGL